MERNPPLILWLRPFDLSDGYPDFNFQKALSRAIAGLAVVVTLKDSRTKNSRKSTYSFINFFSPRFYFSVFLLSQLWGYFAWLFDHRADGIELLLLIACGPIAFLLGIITFFSRLVKGQYSKIEKSPTDRSVGIQRLRVGTVRVFRSSDTLWREVIEFFLCRASAAILDLTDISSSLTWELSQCLAKLGPSRVLVVYRAEDEYYPDEIPEKLLLAAGANWSEQIRVFYYPWTERTSWATDPTLHDELRELIESCIKAAPMPPRLARCRSCGFPIETGQSDTCPKCQEWAKPTRV